MNIQILTDAIQRMIINESISFRELDDYRPVMIAPSAQLEKDCIYVVPFSDASEILAGTDTDIRVTLFVASPSGQTDILNRKNTNIIYVRMNTESLVNILNRRHQLVMMFRLQCADDFSRNDTVSNIIIHMAKDLHSHVFLLDDRFRILLESDYLPTPSEITKAFSRKGHFDAPNRIIKAMQSQNPKESLAYSISSSQNAYIQKIADCGFGDYLAVVAPKNASRIKVDCFIDIAYGFIIRLYNKSDTPLQNQSIELSRLLDYCSGHQNPSPKEIGIYISSLEKKIYRFYSIFVIFPDALTPLEQKKDAFDKVSSYFFDQNVTIYNGLIVVLYSRNSMIYARDIMCGELDRLMKDIGSYIIINNSLSNWIMTYTNYSLAIKAMDIITAVYPLEETRPRQIDINEILPYIGIDIFRSYFISNGATDYSYIYMASPAVIELLKHDNDENDNLLEVLRSYLLSGRNITLTGEKLFLHRNTVRYKVQQVKELMPVDIDDPGQTMPLLASCYVLDYMRKCVRKPLPATTDSGNTDNFSVLPTGSLKL